MLQMSLIQLTQMHKIRNADAMQSPANQAQGPAVQNPAQGPTNQNQAQVPAVQIPVQGPTQVWSKCTCSTITTASP